MDMVKKDLKALESIPSLGNALHIHDDGADPDQIDRISDLPNDILCHILSLLPTKDAVATTILSTKWLNLIPLIPNLQLNLYDTLLPNPERAPITCATRFRIFMNKFMHVTLRDVSSIQSMKLTCQKVYDARVIADWVEAALRLNLKNLELRVGFLWMPFYLVDMLLGCGLESLSLCIEDVEYIHQCGFSLPNLKHLRVHLTKFEIVNPLIQGCPVLESLVVSNCYATKMENLRIRVPSLKDLRISNAFANERGALELDAPNLESFFYRGLLDEYYELKRLGSLGSAHLDVSPKVLEAPFQSEERVVKLLTACCDSRELWLSELFATALMVVPLPMLPQFPNLVTVSMVKMDDVSWEFLSNLLECAPKLVSFVVKEGVDSDSIGKKIFVKNSISVEYSQRSDDYFVLTVGRSEAAEMASASSSA